MALKLLDRIHNRASTLIDNPCIIWMLLSFRSRTNVAFLLFFYRYFESQYYEDLNTISHPSLECRDSWIHSPRVFKFHLIIFCLMSSNKNVFLLYVDLWNSLPKRCFPKNYNLQLFKDRCFDFLLRFSHNL